MDVHTKEYIYRVFIHLICNIFKNDYLRKVFPRKQISQKRQAPQHFLTETKKYDILILKKESCKKRRDSRQFSPFPQKHTISLEFLK